MKYSGFYFLAFVVVVVLWSTLYKRASSPAHQPPPPAKPIQSTPEAASTPADATPRPEPPPPIDQREQELLHSAELAERNADSQHKLLDDAYKTYQPESRIRQLIDLEATSRSNANTYRTALADYRKQRSSANTHTSDFERPSLLQYVRAIDDPIRTDIELRIKLACRGHDCDPDRISFSTLMQYFGDTNNHLLRSFEAKYGTQSDEDAQFFYFRMLKRLVKHAEERRTVVSALSQSEKAAQIRSEFGFPQIEVDPNVEIPVIDDKKEAELNARRASMGLPPMRPLK